MSTHPEERKLATIMFTDMVVLKLLPYWGPRSAKMDLQLVRCLRQLLR